MRHDDRGATLIEVIMGIVLLGLLSPVIFYMVFSISQSFRRSLKEEQVYQVIQSAVEQAKATGPETVGEKIAKSLPAGYALAITPEENHEVEELGLVAYKVTVTEGSSIVREYVYYWTP